MDTKTIQAIISWSLTAIQLGFIIFSIWISSKSTKRLLKLSKERYSIFTKQQLGTLQSFKDVVTNRINLLAKENVKLREENEKLRDKLKNLGFSDITLDN